MKAQQSQGAEFAKRRSVLTRSAQAVVLIMRCCLNNRKPFNVMLAREVYKLREYDILTD